MKNVSVCESLRKKTIAVDVDWVLAKLLDKWLRTYNAIFNDNLVPDDITTWNLVEHVKEEAKPFALNIFDIHKFYRDLEVVSDSQRVLEKLSETYEIIIVTDPYTRMSYKSKHDWLEENFPFIPKKNYVFTGNKSIVKADYLIDDGVHNLESFSGTPILYDSPYSQKEDRFYRVKNWQDIEHVFDHKLQEVHDFYNR